MLSLLLFLSPSPLPSEISVAVGQVGPFIRFASDHPDSGEALRHAVLLRHASDLVLEVVLVDSRFRQHVEPNVVTEASGQL